MNLAKIHKIGAFFYRKHIPVLPTICYILQYLIYNSSVPCSVKIGKQSKFAYFGIGCVIHGRAIIGRKCVIGQGVTIGGRSKKLEVPVIGDNCYLGAGSRILGDIKIGDNTIIGPNAVVLKDIPSNCIAVGVPAKVIKTNINPSEYI